MRYGSVCSGIEAATAAWEPLGWEPAFFSEIDAFPRAVLAHHYPDVPCHGDFTTIGADEYGPVDLLVGGTPCQSFSIAGLRGGLADSRGNLALEFCRLADRKRPRWLVWENVPGVLSSDGGRAFGSILGALAEIGYGLAYRVLDAQYFGVPQRRRRVFVVGYFGDARRAAAVLFERESLCGNPAPRREARESVAPTIAARTRGGGGLGTDFDCDGGLIAAEVAPTLNAHFGAKQGLEDQHIDGGGDCSLPSVAMCLNAGAMGRRDAETETLIPTIGAVFDVAPTMQAGGNSTGGDRPYGTTADTCDSLVPVVFDTAQITSAANYSNPKPGDPCHALASAAHPPAVAFAENSRAELRLCGGDGAVSSQLTTGGGKPGQGRPCVVEPQAYDLRGHEGGSQFEGAHDTANIRAASDGSSRPYVGEAWAVRRLTPVECERLQGFPDQFTLIPWRKKAAEDCPDGPRYKALGNSMAVPCMRWIGERIRLVDAMVDLL